MRNRLAFVIRINVTLVYNKQKCLLQTNTTITSPKSQKKSTKLLSWKCIPLDQTYSSSSSSRLSCVSLVTLVQYLSQHLQRGVQGRPLLQQLHLLAQPVLHPHLVSSITARGAGRARLYTGTYTPLSNHQPLCSIARRSGERVTYDLSCMAMQFARVIWGRSTARVGGSISPYKLLDRNICHLRAGKFVYPVEE